MQTMRSHLAWVFAGELKECRPVAKNAESDAWAAENAMSIRQKRSEYYADWMKKTEAERPHLALEDGR